MRKNLPSFFLGAIGAAFLTAAGIASATRNAGGTYSLYSPGNPVVGGTTISSSWANNTLADLSTEMTDSLSRSGKGGMLAALRGIDGTVASPALSFTSEPGTGQYRIGAGDIGMAILGVKVGEWTANGLRVANGAVGTPSLSFFNDTSSGIYRAGASDLRMAVAGVDTWRWGSNFVSILSGQHLRFDGNTYTGFGGIWLGSTDADSPTTTNYAVLGNATTTALNTPTGGTIQFNVQDSPKASVTGSGLIIGASGTALSSSTTGTVSWTPGNLLTQTCAGNNITMVGATTGAPCALGPPSLSVSGIVATCAITSATQCAVNVCNPTTITQTAPAGTYTCRVFNP